MLQTSSFKVDRGSVLHSGIFNKELASSFVSAVFIVIYLISMAVLGEIGLIHYLVAAVIFVIIFPLSRTFIFKAPVLITEVDKGSGVVTLTLKRNLGSRVIGKDFSELRQFDVEYIRIEPENPDGVAVVEKIALQHGTVIPGFGEVKEFYNVVARFADSDQVVFTTTSDAEAKKVVDTLNSYVVKT